MLKYHVELILNTLSRLDKEEIKNNFLEFAEDIKIVLIGQDDKKVSYDLKISLFTDEPTIIFDTCAQFGRIKSVKIDENRGG
ncbi:MAG: hypothetical protein NC912_02635 [Candidatus Omnitrophica bacterium]|nr:hypothetical protein [Candidatus Omnitrophota bacterium]